MSTAIKVLVVEDSEDDATLAIRRLRRGGFDAQYVRVESAAAMEAALKQEGWDAVISDFKMPGFTGMDALRIFRACGLDIPFILISGAIGEETAVEAMKAGASDYVMKKNLARLASALKRELKEAAVRAAHRQAQRELVESEARFRVLTEISSDFYWESDAEHRLTKRASADRKLSAVSVFQQGAQIGQRRWEVPYLSPDEAGWQAHRAVLDAHLPFRDFELSRRGADGSERFIAVSGDPLFDATGAFKGYRGVGTDITERKRAEGELRKLALAVRQSGTGIMITDAAGAIEFVNPKYEAMTGYCAAEVKGQNPRFVKSGATPQEVYRDLWSTITAGKEWSGEIQNRRKSGEMYWESEHISPVLDDSGRILQFIAIKEDITERKWAEKALHASEEELRMIFEGVRDGILAADIETKKFLKANSAICQMLGYAPEEMVRIGVPDIHRAEDLPRAIEEFERLLRGEIQIAADIPVMRKDGSVFHADIKAAPIRLGDKDGLLGIFRDVTERRQAQEKIQRLNRVYAVLSGINALLIRVSDRDELFAGACRIAAEAGQFRMSWIGVVDWNAMKIVPVAWAGSKPEHNAFIGDRYSLDENAPTGNSLTARAIREKKAFFSNDTQNDSRLRFKKEHVESGTRSIAILPLVVSDKAVGVLVLYAGEVGFFNEEELKLLTELAGDISFALDHIEKAKQLDYLAYYDSLTGLANRTLLQERLNQYVHTAHENQGKFAVILMDIERFKTINDSLGRQAGDELLKQLAERLGRATDPARIARVGGNHFAIVLPEIKGRSQIGRTMEQIWRDCFAQPFQVGDKQLRVSAKAGIALFPNDGANAEMLYSNAEAALEEAQQTGERHQFHSRDLTAGVSEQLALENRLRQALEKDEFVLHYQPKVELDSRRIVGAEALIRWQSPELGLVPPGKFIPLMEETGLILEVGAWALSRAVADHARWLAQGIPAPRVAVNMSAIQLRRRDFVATVEEALKRGATPPGIDLEITESLIMQNIEGNIEKLKAVRGLGVALAIDDFGTGYSSLGYLAKLPLQALKIDRSFIVTMLNDPDTMTLVSTIISLAQSLRLKVIAEGVETEEQAKMLRLLRCDEIQGYLVSRPVPFEQMTVLLELARAGTHALSLP